MKLTPVIHKYKTNLSWTTQKKGRLRCDNKPDISVACPPEWGGHPNIWSPEDLFVGAIEVCVMTTFLWLSGKKHVNLLSYTSKTCAAAYMKENNFQFSSIDIILKIGVATDKDKDKAKKIIPELTHWCIVSKSIKPKVKINAEIFVDNVHLQDKKV